MPKIGGPRRKWWVLAAMSGVLGLVVLDETVVGIALVTMRSDLAMSDVASHWVVNVYLLTFTCFVAIGGRLGDRLGHRGVFLFGMILFGLASVASGTAQSGAWLIAARAVQGIGGAIIFPASWAIMTNTFPPDQRGLAFGIQVTVAGLFMASGPLVGGLFTEALSWRWIFWINLPVVAAVAAVALATLSSGTGESRPGLLDLRGLVTLVTGLTLVVVALMEGGDWGWSDPLTLGLLFGGGALLALFWRTERALDDPLIEVGLLKIATFTGGNLVFFMFQFNKVAVFVFVALYLQEVLHQSPIDAGIIVMIGIVPALFTSILGGKAADRFGSRRPLALGLLLNGVALLLLGAATSIDSIYAIVAPLVLWGAMLPVTAVTARRALMGAVPADKQGQASGVNLTIQMLGGTVGMALCSALLAATGDYGSLFYLTGALVLAVLVVAWVTVER